MKERGIQTVAIVIVVIVAAGAAVAGGYFVMSENGDGGEDEFIDVGNLSGLEATIGVGDVGENVEWVGDLRVTNMDDERNLKLRLDYYAENRGGPSGLILNRELENLWIYAEGAQLPGNLEPGWFIAPREQYAKTENQVLEIHNAIVENIPENWKGEGFTIEEEYEDLHLKDITVNPDFDEGLFVVENYQEIPSE